MSSVGCGNASIATPVHAASPVVAVTTIPVAPLATVAVVQTSAKGDWGSIKGQIVADGEITPLKLLVTKGDAAAKDSSVCAAQDVPDESLVVDAKGGIANVVVYLQKKPAKVHPELEKA